MFSNDREFIRSFIGIGPTGPEFGREVTRREQGEWLNLRSSFEGET
jgi:hypothetical protein